jgi:hypothetical protein
VFLHSVVLVVVVALALWVATALEELVEMVAVVLHLL